jgi:hypothetical protein
MRTGRQIYGCTDEANSRLTRFCDCASKGVLESASVAAHVLYMRLRWIGMSNLTSQQNFSNGKNRKYAMDRKLVDAAENIHILAYSSKDFYPMSVSSCLINLEEGR